MGGGGEAGAAGRDRSYGAGAGCGPAEPAEVDGSIRASRGSQGRGSLDAGVSAEQRAAAPAFVELLAARHRRGEPVVWWKWNRREVRSCGWS